jgi:hypothetical protein
VESRGQAQMGGGLGGITSIPKYNAGTSVLGAAASQALGGGIGGG